MLLSLPVKGGQYRAERKGAHIVIYDVPVFGEVPAWERGNSAPVDAQWHQRALAAHQARKQLGEYIPPLHVGHHEIGARVEHAGFFDLVRAGTIQYNGSNHSVLFANLYAIPSVARLIQTGRCPYLSAEVPPDFTPKILSLALLDDEPPHFEFPLLTLAPDTEQFAARPARVSFRSQSVRFSMPMHNQPLDVAQAGGGQDDSPAANAAPAAADMPPWGEALAALIAEKISVAMGGGAPAPTQPPADAYDDDGADSEPEGSADKSTQYAAQIARLQATVNRLEWERSVASDLATAEEKLRLHFGAVSDVQRESLRAFRNESAAALNAYVTGLLTVGTPQSAAPPRFAANKAGAPTEADADAMNSPEVRMFSAAIRHAAARAYRDWVAGGKSVSWDRFARSRGITQEAQA